MNDNENERVRDLYQALVAVLRAEEQRIGCTAPEMVGVLGGIAGEITGVTVAPDNQAGDGIMLDVLVSSFYSFKGSRRVAAAN